MTYLLLYILLFLMILPGIKAQKSDGSLINIAASMEQMNKLRGLFAVVIVVSHCTMSFEKLPAILFPLNKISTFLVGTFFLLSGYGLAYSAANKEGYLEHFPKKILRLVLIGAIFGVLCEGIQAVVLKRRFSFPVNWYMIALPVCYCVFYLSYRLFPENIKAHLLCVFTSVILLMLLVLILFPEHRTYYISETAFPLGIALYEYGDRLNEIFRRKSVVLFSVLSMIVIFPLAMLSEEKTLPDMLLHNLMLIPFVTIMLVICSRFSFGNVILRYLSRSSLYIYLIQFVYLGIISQIYSDCGRSPDVLYFILVLVFTCLSAFAVSFTASIIEQVFQRNS